MPTLTTNMHLQKPIDSDNAESALATYIPAAFDAIDHHAHTGGTDGVQVAVGGLAAGACTGGALGTDVCTVNGTQTLTNKTMTSPVLNTPSDVSPSISGHINTSGTVPVGVAQSGAGSGPPVVSFGAGSSDIRGGIVLTTGGSGTAPGAFVRINWHAAFGQAPVVVIMPTNTDTAALQLALTTSATDHAIWSTAQTPATGTGYAFQYMVMG